MTPHEQEKLERFVDGAVRGLPPRPAPASLERRVLAAIERRAALPWWRKNYLHWPMAARAAFCLFSVGALLLGLRLFADLDVGTALGGMVERFGWVDAIGAVGSALRNFASILLGNIPAWWLYGGLGFIAVMYVALFGLGAAAYRALYRSH